MSGDITYVYMTDGELRGAYWRAEIAGYAWAVLLIAVVVSMVARVIADGPGWFLAWRALSVSVAMYRIWVAAGRSVGADQALRQRRLRRGRQS